MGAGVVTQVRPAVFNRTITEGYLTQPNVMGAVRARGFALEGTLNFEGYTLQRGELNPGIYGEGYIDRRHPHTLVHEVMASYTTRFSPVLQASLAAGKGFTPYGTDDPMMRPFIAFPVNHHHAQIIERVQTIGALALGSSSRGVRLEHAFFNGDEPAGPFTGPQWKRFGDSRTSRVTLLPWRGVEVQASRAFVRSPGITQGGAFDHTQSSASVRIDRAVDDGSMPGMSMARDRRYLLLELARTDEGFGSQRVFRYNSVLGEALVAHRNWALALRAERTERPESERLLDPFRMANGHIDFQIIGVTRWSVATVHIDAPAFLVPYVRRAQVAPFVEVSAAEGKALRLPAVFVPREFYGAGTLWSLSAGMRVHVGAMRDRMGRYGVMW